MNIHSAKIVASQYFADQDAIFKRAAENGGDATNVSYAIALCRRIEIEVESEGKAMRWLGFIQGVLWAEHVFTVHDLKEHNRRAAGK